MCPASQCARQVGHCVLDCVTVRYYISESGRTKSTSLLYLQAKNDYVNGWHDAFGDCDEYGQTECKGPNGKVGDCIQAYINEGSSGRHYKILTDSKIKYGVCGVYKANSKTVSELLTP